MKYTRLYAIEYLIIFLIFQCQSTELQSVFHHRGLSTGQNNDLHIASLIFYFNQNPIMNNIPLTTKKQSDTCQKVRFFFPHAKVKNSSCKSMIDALAQHESKLYTISITQEQSPVPGIALSITYNPAKISFYHAHFNPMQKFSGVMFRFYNKDILHELSRHDNPVLCVVQKKKPRVAIDCGHGGHDSGATVQGTLEKKITLEVGKQLAILLRRNGCQTILIRNKDMFVPLDDRTSIANSAQADLFVSIHANYAHRSQVTGIETYHLPSSLIYDHTCVAYNDASNTIVSMIKKQEEKRLRASMLFAQSLQKYTYLTAQKSYKEAVDRSVKQKALQVLLGTTMPAGLIELGFITNPHECALLNQKSYQQLLAQGICTAILQYFHSA